MPWWTRQNHADRRPLLLQRGRLKAAIRAHFEAQDFIEVECGALVVSPGNETHLHAFETGTELRAGLTRWIGYYNTGRPHSALGGLTPDEAFNATGRADTKLLKLAA